MRGSGIGVEYQWESAERATPLVVPAHGVACVTSVAVVESTDVVYEFLVGQRVVRS